MSESVEPAGSVDPVQPEALRLLATLRAGAAELVGCLERAWALSPTEKGWALEELAALRGTADAAHLALVRALTQADASELGATSVSALVSWRLRVPPGRARADVEAARVTDPETGELKGLGAALAAGKVSLGHVDAGRRTLDHLPARLHAQHAAGIDAFLVQQSATFRPQECEHLAGRVLDRIDPDRADRGFDPDDFARRSFTMSSDSTGMTQVRGQLDPVTAAQLKAAIDHHAKPVPATTTDVAEGPDGSQQTQVRVVDDRTPAQRRADALGVIARQGLDHAGTRGGEPPRVIVHATPDQLTATPGAGQATCEQTGPVTATILRRLQCDAALSAVLLAPSGAVLDLGRTTRCATPAQRRALLARDGGCVIPGCTAPSAQLEAHHVLAWAAGGLTDVDGMVLACGPHHTIIELGTWGVRMVHGVPQVRAPRWVDPEQHWLRLPRRTAEAAARALGEQLTLPTDAPRTTADARRSSPAGAGTAAEPPGPGPEPP